MQQVRAVTNGNGQQRGYRFISLHFSGIISMYGWDPLMSINKHLSSRLTDAASKMNYACHIYTSIILIACHNDCDWFSKNAGGKCKT